MRLIELPIIIVQRFISFQKINLGQGPLAKLEPRALQGLDSTSFSIEWVVRLQAGTKGAGRDTLARSELSAMKEDERPDTPLPTPSVKNV
ncbi:hypothetical protein Tco_0494839 [Tanacetum coccineum]